MIAAGLISHFEFSQKKINVLEYKSFCSVLLLHLLSAYFLFAYVSSRFINSKDVRAKNKTLEIITLEKL